MAPGPIEKSARTQGLVHAGVEEARRQAPLLGSSFGFRSGQREFLFALEPVI